jgi:hypothetical protein
MLTFSILTNKLQNILFRIFIKNGLETCEFYSGSVGCNTLMHVTDAHSSLLYCDSGFFFSTESVNFQLWSIAENGSAPAIMKKSFYVRPDFIHFATCLQRENVY